ncbi:mobilization protein MbeA [Escherichia coli H252]|nr:mobilization protein MbeA [Escherichia coli H252]
MNAQFSATENELARRQEELLWKLVKGRILYPSLTALCVTGGIFLASWGRDSVAGKPDCGEHPGYQGPGRDAGETPGKTMGCDVSRGQEREISGVAVRGEGGNELDGGEEERSKTGQGVSEYDRAGNSTY